MLTILSTQAGIALKNANLYLQMENSRQKFRSLLDIIAALQSEVRGAERSVAMERRGTNLRKRLRTYFSNTEYFFLSLLHLHSSELIALSSP